MMEGGNGMIQKQKGEKEILEIDAEEEERKDTDLEGINIEDLTKEVGVEVGKEIGGMIEKAVEDIVENAISKEAGEDENKEKIEVTMKKADEKNKSVETKDEIVTVGMLDSLKKEIVDTVKDLLSDGKKSEKEKKEFVRKSVELDSEAITEIIKSTVETMFKDLSVVRKKKSFLKSSGDKKEDDKFERKSRGDMSEEDLNRLDPVERARILDEEFKLRIAGG